MTQHKHLDDEIHQLNTRMALVEQDLKLIAGMRKWIVTGVIAIIAQAGGVVYTYGQLTAQVELIAGVDLARDVSTSRRVLADHGSELESVRLEQARVRERLDIVADRHNEHVAKGGHEKLTGRVARLEDKVYQ